MPSPQRGAAVTTIDPPPAGDLTSDQRRGTDCAYGDGPVSPDDVVDLGERRDEDGTLLFPRAHPHCHAWRAAAAAGVRTILTDPTGRVGEYVADAGGWACLRPVRWEPDFWVPVQALRPATEAELAEAERAVCRFCEQRTADPVVVGRTRSMSGYGWPIEACPACVRFRRLMPFDEHPVESMGSVRHTDGTILEQAV